jgi:hypothetical protein
MQANLPGLVFPSREVQNGKGYFFPLAILFLHLPFKMYIYKNL